MKNKPTLLFLDAEFSGLHKHTTLISLAIVAETGESFYYECSDYDALQCDDWIIENVIAHLTNALMLHNSVEYKDDKTTRGRGTKEFLAQYLSTWLTQFKNIQFVADVPHYDWVLFCDIFGGAFSIPKNIHYICLDMATMIHEYEPYWVDKDRVEFIGTDMQDHIINKLGMSKETASHNALYDAYLCKFCYLKLESLKNIKNQKIG